MTETVTIREVCLRDGLQITLNAAAEAATAPAAEAEAAAE